MAQQDAERARFIVDKAAQEKKSMIIKAQGEAKSAKLIGDAIRDNPGFIQLRKLEAARDIAATLCAPPLAPSPLPRRLAPHSLRTASAQPPTASAQPPHSLRSASAQPPTLRSSAPPRPQACRSRLSGLSGSLHTVVPTI